MERARFEKRFWDVQFPTVAAESGGVKQHGDQVEFVVGRRAGQKQCRPNLAAIPKSVIQTSAGFITGIVALHLVEQHRTLHGRLIAKSHVRVFVRNSE